MPPPLESAAQGVCPPRHCISRAASVCAVATEAAISHFIHGTGYGTVASSATVPSRRDYGAVNTVSFSVSVTKLVLTPTRTLNDPLQPNFTTTQHNYTGFNPKT